MEMDSTATPDRAGPAHQADHSLVACDTFFILLLEGFSLLSFAAVTEPLALLQVRKGGHYPILVSAGQPGNQARSRDGTRVTCDITFAELRSHLMERPRQTALILCGPFEGEVVDARPVRALVRHAARSGVPIIGLDRATWLMAEAGLLADRDAALHWSSAKAFEERFLRSRAVNALFLRDGSIGTCAGALASLDLSLDLVRTIAPADLPAIADMLLVSYPRRGKSRQPGAQGERIRHLPRVLSRAVDLMAQNIESPLSLARITAICGVSHRHLERQFRDHLNTSPKRYYLSQRLEVAHQLVSQSELELDQVALASGFRTRAHFVKLFRETYGLTPGQMRRQTRCSSTAGSLVRNHPNTRDSGVHKPVK